MVMLRKQFLKDFQEKGFGFVEGSKWTTYTSQEDVIAPEEYMTRAQIWKAECKDDKNTDAKIAWAIAQGEGTDAPKQGRGYYKDETRQNEYVYRYASNLKMVQTQSRRDGHQTKNHTGVLNLPTPQQAGPPGMIPIQNVEASEPATPAGTLTPPGGPLSPRGSMEAMGSPTSSQSFTPLSPSDSLTLANRGSSGKGGQDETLANPGSSGQGVPEDIFDVASLQKKAQLMHDQMVGIAMLSGFHSELNIAMAAVKAVHTPRANYRCVRNLTMIVEMSEKVLKVVEPDV